MNPSTPAARAKVVEAMRLVEEAQHTLERACQQLSSLRHGADLYSKCGKLRDGAHSFFYRLSDALRSRGRMSVDSEPEPRPRHTQPDDAGVIAAEQTVEADGSWEPR